MKGPTRILPALWLGLAAGLTACGGGYGDPPAEPPMEPPPPPVVFSQFVKDQFTNTVDEVPPVAVDAMAFSFTDQDNPDAFDDLLASP
jgi:hypothetical protein